MSRNGFGEISRSIGYPVSEIMTHKENWVFWDGEPTSRAKTVADAGSKITFIPVMKGKRVSGVIRRDDLAAGKRAKSLTAHWLIAADTPILGLISLFADDPDRIYFVLQSSEIIGLVTFADLNKVQARASVYLLTAHFEVELAKLIRLVIPEEDQYINFVQRKGHKGSARRAQERARVENIDLDLLHYLYLEDLTDIAAVHDGLRQLLEFDSQDAASAILDFKAVRDKVSHSANKFINTCNDVPLISDACIRLVEGNKRIAKAFKTLDDRAKAPSARQ